ncbi:hypothetical protein Ccrd_020318 [Cynara cardunculus var. scolymus]|uniref:Uncharacterized protein n=1 Tax=Cynara cardunculus var. scolymus TaxID=59895 RepID=A0A124SEW6_CYNCS|nr:hypothetical protein Ccrd_020318 [Cynara cardunculus var. scolymus]
MTPATLSSKMTIHVQVMIHTLDDSKMITPLNEDTNQVVELEKRKHKLKCLVQSPNSFFMLFIVPC